MKRRKVDSLTAVNVTITDNDGARIRTPVSV